MEPYGCTVAYNDLLIVENVPSFETYEIHPQNLRVLLADGPPADAPGIPPAGVPAREAAGVPAWAAVAQSSPLGSPSTKCPPPAAMVGLHAGSDDAPHSFKSQGCDFSCLSSPSPFFKKFLFICTESLLDLCPGPSATVDPATPGAVASLGCVPCASDPVYHTINVRWHLQTGSDPESCWHG